MILAVEDAVSAAAGETLIRVARPGERIDATLGRRGKGYLLRRARELNRTAENIPVLLLIDLDNRSTCVPTVVKQWFGTRHPHLTFRVAVMEIEAWLLGDRDGISDFLGIHPHRIPSDVDSIDDPKQLLVRLAQKSRFKRVREDLAPSEGSTATVGPGYNPRLVEFATNVWDPITAAGSSQSLSRALAAIRRT